MKGTPSETDAYTLTTLGIQAVVLTATDAEATTKKQIQTLRELLEKVHQDEKEKSSTIKL